MKKKITYIIITAAISTDAFFIGRNTAPEPTSGECIEEACKYITYWESTDIGINLYDVVGNVYEWR